MPTTLRPTLSIQTASLWASGDSSTFSGTGGPGYDPFFGFNGVVSSAVINAQPFNDRLFGVDAGDQVVFVIAIQNFSGNAAAYDVKLRNSVPLGFVIPLSGADLSVTDGAGNLLASSGNLFDPNGGLVIRDPLDTYSENSGGNVALVTFTLQATSTVAAPLANITDNAQIVSFAGSPGGTSFFSNGDNIPLSATTPVQTAGITVATTGLPTQTLVSGQTASFEITVTLPEGTVQDLRINELLPHAGNAWLSLVSAQIVSFGSNLSATLPVAVQPDGSILLGAVTDAYDNVQTAGDQIVVRVTVANGGTAAGTGTLNTAISAADPNAPGQRWSTTVTNTIPLATPDVPPTIAGVSANQNTTSSLPVFPFSSLTLADPDVGQTQTLTIHLSDPALGTLGGLSGLAPNGNGDYVLSGSVAAVQSAARSLVFTPAAGAIGAERFSLTLNDGSGGTASDQRTTITVAPASNPSTLTHFAISTQTVLTSTVSGSSTLTPVEIYAGALDNVQTQFLYDGTAPIAIVAQQTSMLISSHANATAVQLLGGANVLDMQFGSSFIVGGSGNDTFIFHADQPQPTWNTISNFHAGDSITIYGFNPATGSRYFDSSAGATGFAGATLRLDLNRDGIVDSSLTFAGKTTAETSLYHATTGNVGGSDYLLITA